MQNDRVVHVHDALEGAAYRAGGGARRWFVCNSCVNAPGEPEVGMEVCSQGLRSYAIGIKSK
jgi:hypothetical protein